MSRYYNFEIYNNLKDKAVYSSKTIAAIKRYISKNNIDISIGTSLVIRCYDVGLEDFIVVSLYDFYSRTGAAAVDKDNMIHQQEFHRDYRNSRYINVGM